LKIGLTTAFVTFLIGTLILVLYFFFRNIEVLLIGATYILLAAFGNIVVVLFLVLNIKKDKALKGKLVRTLGIMLLNIPIMFLYIHLAQIAGQYLRVIISNSTKSEVTNLEITGCGIGGLEKLDAGESASIWVKIVHECPIGITYISQGVLIEEQIAGDSIERDDIKFVIESNHQSF
jgi:hypothetical protein